MSKKEKARTNGPIPNAVLADTPESKLFPDHVQASARAVFGHHVIVVQEPIGERFRKRVKRRIRAWRAPA